MTRNALLQSRRKRRDPCGCEHARRNERDQNKLLDATGLQGAGKVGM